MPDPADPIPPGVSDQDIAARHAAEQTDDDALQADIDAARTRRDNAEFEAARRQPTAADLDDTDPDDTSQPIGAPLVDPASAHVAGMMSAGGDDDNPTADIDVAGMELLATTDAQVWAREFVNRFRRHMVDDPGTIDQPGWVNEGTMLAWFANAIETGRSAGRGQLHGEAAVRRVVASAFATDYAKSGGTFSPSLLIDDVTAAVMSALNDGPEYGTIPPSVAAADDDPDHNAARPPTTRLVNLTPHDVVIYRNIVTGTDDLDDPTCVEVDGTGWVEAARIPAGPTPARLGTVDLGQWDTIDVDGHPVWVEGIEFGHIENPPPGEPGTRYIVSLPTALAVHRADFLVPFDEVRDADGRILGCRGLAKVAG